MSVQELIDMLQAVEDREMQVVFLTGVDGNHFIFQQPCPTESGVTDLGNIVPSIGPSGEVNNLHLAGETVTVFALLPHNPSNPHDDNNSEEL